MEYKVPYSIINDEVFCFEVNYRKTRLVKPCIGIVEHCTVYVMTETCGQRLMDHFNKEFNIWEYKLDTIVKPVSVS